MQLENMQYGINQTFNDMWINTQFDVNKLYFNS